MEYNKENPDKDFLRRSYENYISIKEKTKYDFTQLFSNFLIAVVILKENNAKTKTLKGTMEENGLNCTVIFDNYNIKMKDNVSKFIDHLRNAGSHTRIKVNSENREIANIKFFDVNMRNEKEKCEFIMNVKEIEETYIFILKLLDIVN